MKQTFTKKFMQHNCGCYSLTQLEACSFMQSDEITLADIIESEIPLRDKFWFVIRKCASIDELKEIAIEVAECVLPIYEEKYQNNKAPRNAIEAAKKYIKGEITLDELVIARSAADAADAAADAAYAAAYADAADAAAAAAYAADAAAYAAADAAYAAADAAYAAAAAAAADADADAAYKTKLLNILKAKVAVAV
jgi:hypothetical protein